MVPSVRLTKSLNTPEELKQKRALRFWRQSKAAKALPLQRVSKCLRSLMPGSDHVAIGITKQGNVSAKNLVTCGSVWHCPVCAAKISEYRRLELTTAMDSAREKGLHATMLTLTLPHYTRDSVKAVLNNLTRARVKFTNRRIWKRFCAQASVVGTIRALETTYGGNGWHCHFHVLVLTRKKMLPADRKAYEKVLLASWLDCLDSVGCAGGNHHALTLQSGSYAAKYVGKWGIAHELSKAHVKKGRNGSLSPFELLDSRENLMHFREYAMAFKGRRQLVWSDGLKKMLLNSSVEITDEEICSELDDATETLWRIAIPAWRAIVRRGHRECVFNGDFFSVDPALYPYLYFGDDNWIYLHSDFG